MPAKTLILFVAAVVMALVTPGSAAAGEITCGDLGDLENTAIRGRLSTDQRDCLETELETTPPEFRVRASFILIIQAHMDGDEDVYETKLERHLHRIHSGDADVAYLYALHLSKKGVAYGEDVIRWVNVALSNKGQWSPYPQTFRNMVKALYNLRNEASMMRSIEAEKWQNSNPSASNQRRLEQYQQRARYYLSVSAPCLAQGDCGPHFEVKIEGVADCEDLFLLTASAKKGTLTDPELTCLRSRYQRPAAPRSKILDILATQASTADDATTWEDLLSWHRNLTGGDDPYLSYRYAGFLGTQGAPYANEVLRWGDIALRSSDSLTRRQTRKLQYDIYRLRAEAAFDLWQAALIDDRSDPTVYTKERVAATRESAKRYSAQLTGFCNGGGRCPRGWTAPVVP